MSLFDSVVLHSEPGSESVFISRDKLSLWYLFKSISFLEILILRKLDKKLAHKETCFLSLVLLYTLIVLFEEEISNV